MKLIVIAAVILGIGMLAGTRKDTPFIRWGVVIALVGVLLTLTSAIFTVRGVAFGTILAIVGVGLYYYGRLARKERIFVGSGASALRASRPPEAKLPGPPAYGPPADRESPSK